MACTVEEAARTAELEGVLEEERKENTKQGGCPGVLEEERKENTKQGGCPHAALPLSTANFERTKSRVLLTKYYN